MPRIKMKQVQGVGRVTLEYAIDQFMRHNRLKNLSSRTLEYYEEDLRYFQRTTAVTYLDEITDKLYEDFILHEMDKGNKMTAVNCRTRGLRVFLRFCAKREYMELIHIPMMKEDETFKEPYTDAELQSLLKKPTSDSFVEWRCWAAINTFLATGIRASTLVNIKIGDVDFEHDTIHLSKLKNRKQQFVPLSQSLKAALTTYLKLWEWDSGDFLFPTNDGQQMRVTCLEGSVRRYNISRGVTKTSLHGADYTYTANDDSGRCFFDNNLTMFRMNDDWYVSVRCNGKDTKEEVEGFLEDAYWTIYNDMGLDPYCEEKNPTLVFYNLYIG